MLKKLSEYRAGIQKWTDSILQGTHHHHSCYLPKNLGWVSSLTFKLFFSGIELKEDQLAKVKNIPEDAVIVYAGKYKSYFEYFFYHTRYKNNGVPPPEIGFDYEVLMVQPVFRIFRMIFAHLDYFCRTCALPDPYESGYIRDELMNGRAGILSLVERKGFYRRFVKADTDPMRYLIEMQKSVDRPIYIIPQLMFFSTKPARAIPTLLDILFGTKERPGTLRRLVTLFNNPGKVFVEISDPLNLKNFIQIPENRDMDTDTLALMLRRRLLVQMNRHRQSITGPILKSKEELKENILTNDRLREFMEDHSTNRNIPLWKVHKEADAYLDEIAAKYSPAMIRVFATLVRLITRLMFEGMTVNIDVLNKAKNMAQKGPLILVPCHKSHIDYLILSYVLFQNNMPCPHVAAGKNLSFWPMGPLFRSGGAFFIRRTFRGAVLYSKVFSEYVYKLLEEGFNVEFFIEGGRSRTGKLLQPKLGLLSILLNAYKNGACEDMIFVPVYIGYDRVPEESSYLYELEGGEKKPEDLSQVIKARKVLKKRYGIIYIQFHEPISLNDLLAQNGSLKDMPQKAYNAFCRNLGYRFLNAIDRVTVVTPHAIVASAILNCSKQPFSYGHLMSDIEIYMNYLFSKGATLADTLLMDYTHAIKYVFDSYVQRKFIERVPTDKNGQPFAEQFVVNENKRPILDYYKNNGIYFFIPAAFTALAILEKDAFQFSASELQESYKFLQDFFINEFAYDVDKTPEHFLQKNIRAFMDEAVLMPHPTLPDTYNLTSAGFRTLKLFSGFLRTYFESYWIVLNFFMRYPKDFIETKDRMKKIQSLGIRMLKRKEIWRSEAISLINYKNAADFFTSHGIKSADDSEKIEFYAGKIKRFLEYLP
jgi:glycerol-3-phosphate O-acyltransferase